jgi:hypothetical protein
LDGAHHSDSFRSKAAAAITLDEGDDEDMEAAMMRATAAAEAAAAAAVASDDVVEIEDGPAEAAGASMRYEICATVWHAGSAAGAGHYIADVRRPPQEVGAPPTWQRFDDSFVRVIASNAPEVFTKGYIFFYVHRDALGEHRGRARNNMERQGP